MSEREALELVRRLLMEALGQYPQTSSTMIRDLAGQNGALRAAMRAALTVITAAGVEK